MRTKRADRRMVTKWGGLNLHRPVGPRLIKAKRGRFGFGRWSFMAANGKNYSSPRGMSTQFLIYYSTCRSTVSLTKLYFRGESEMFGTRGFKANSWGLISILYLLANHMNQHY